MNVELGKWKVFRLIGQGERENVRALLLQVAALNPTHIEQQLNGAYNFAEKHGLRLRIFIDVEQIGAEKINHIMRHVWKNRVEHDLMEVKTSDEPLVLSKVDLVIKPLTGAIADESIIHNAIEQAWNLTGGRGGILAAKGAFYSTQEIKDRFPQFHYAQDELLN